MAEELPQPSSISGFAFQDYPRVLTSSHSPARLTFFHAFTFSNISLSLSLPFRSISCITKALSFIFYHPKGNYSESTGPEVESQCYPEPV